MGNIDVKIKEITNYINQLKKLKQTLDSSKKAPPSTVGGGQTVNELEEIGKMYQMLNTHLSSMIGSTISFLEVTRRGFETTDAGLAKKLKP